MPTSTHRLRVRSGVIALAGAAAFTGIACKPFPVNPPTPPDTTTRTTIPGPTSIPGPTTIPAPTTLPGPTTIPGPSGTIVPPTTPPAPDGAIDCGTLRYASGWPTTMFTRLNSCLPDAFQRGTAARLITREQTDGHGGRILITYYDVVGVRRVVVTVDPTNALPPGPVTRRECRELRHDESHLYPGDCTAR